MTVAPPSDDRECRDREDSVEMVDGVETARSSSGTASSARDGDVLGEGELGLWSGEATLLSGGLIIVSAMLSAWLRSSDSRTVPAGVPSPGDYKSAAARPLS